jgi:hypothetical protein
MRPTQTHEQLLAGEVYTTSIINEPIENDVVDFVVDQRESAEARAFRRWFNRGQEDDRRDL